MNNSDKNTTKSISFKTSVFMLKAKYSAKYKLILVIFGFSNPMPMGRFIQT